LELLSKKIQLGVIILALQLLGTLKIPFVPRIVRRAAQLFGVSRKSGYQAARWIREVLQNQPAAGPEDPLRRENIRLRIQNQVLAFERDHPGVRFADRHAHLPPEARSLCVRILRDFQSELSESSIAAEIGVPLSSLRRWDHAAGADFRFPEKPERRGTHRRAGPEDVARVIKEYLGLEKSMTLEEFTQSFNRLHPDSPLDRKTITRILQAHHLSPIETRRPGEPYHPPFQVYFPGAQAAVDGKVCKVFFRSEPHKGFPVLEEVAIDIASTAILGEALQKRENAEGVQRVLVQAREECAPLLAVLSDNGPANRSAAVGKTIEEESQVGQIFSFPYHPQTNGHLEGLFGQFVRIAGRIEIDDTSKESLARSIVKTLWRIFIHFHNHSPRARLGGLSPLEYLRRYAALPEEVERAKRGLQKQRERSEALRQKHPRLSDPAFRSLVEGIQKLHRLEANTEEALRALLPYDLRVIQSASHAFLVQSQRDGFDERKRTFAYFLGIVRNKQKEIDQERLRSHLEAKAMDRFRMEEAQAQEAIRREEAEEAQDLRLDPDRVVLKYAQLLLSGGLRWMRRTFGEGLRRGLKALHERGQGRPETLQRLAGTIQSWGKYRENLKEEMVKLLLAEYQIVVDPG
jgi:transposase InsO family protein